MRKTDQKSVTRIGLLVMIELILLSACATSNRVQVVPTTTFDRAWLAALDAARFEGVRVASEARDSGLIIGTKGQQDVTIHVLQETDDKVRLEIDVRAPEGAEPEPGLAGRISRAYERRMQR